MLELNFNKLKNSSLFTLGMRVKDLIEAKKTPEMGIDFYFARYQPAFAKYKVAMERGVVRSGELAQKDAFRDSMWSALRAHVKNYLRHPQLSAVAKVVLAEIDKYGKRVGNKNYEDETAVIENVCTILENKHNADLTSLRANDWFDLLKQANTYFETAQRSYNEQVSVEKQTEAASSVRPELENAMRNLFSFLPMQAEVTGNSDLVELVNDLEVEISRF